MFFTNFLSPDLLLNLDLIRLSPSPHFIALLTRCHSIRFTKPTTIIRWKNWLIARKTILVFNQRIADDFWSFLLKTRMMMVRRGVEKFDVLSCPPHLEPTHLFPLFRIVYKLSWPTPDLQLKCRNIENCWCLVHDDLRT